MCKFKSAIVLFDGSVLHDEMTDSHEDLIAMNNLKDDGSVLSRMWVRVEFVPKSFREAQNPENWVLSLDESSTPHWWENVEEQARASLWNIVKRSIVCDHRKCLSVGTWMFMPGANIRKVIGGRILFCSSAADLQDANLWGANLQGANLRGANLQGANLQGAIGV